MVSRQHHYISQFYLRGFSSEGSKKTKLTVIDLVSNKTFVTTPRNVGGIRDFNRIDSDSIAPDAIENIYSEFESKAAKSIKAIEQGAFFDGEHKNIIINLIALYAVRSPQRRERVRSLHEDISRRSFDLLLSSEQHWNSNKNKIFPSGHNVNQDLTYKEMRSFHDKKIHTLELDSAYHIDIEMNMLEPVFNSLANRNWMLIESVDEKFPFITTDNPVVLSWINPTEMPTLYQNAIGYNNRDTRLIFPLTRKHLLVGDFKGIDGKIQVNGEMVARFNSNLLLLAIRQIYASKIHFYFMDMNDNLVVGSKYLSFYKSLESDKPE